MRGNTFGIVKQLALGISDASLTSGLVPPVFYVKFTRLTGFNSIISEFFSGIPKVFFIQFIVLSLIMNIFVLHTNPRLASIYHCDKHVVKMPLETAQMLCTVLYKYGYEVPYRPTHKNHPCTIWAGVSRANFIWLCELGIALCREYTYRYGKRHKCHSIIEWCMGMFEVLPATTLTEHPMAMPEYLKIGNDPVTAYRLYYIKEKAHLLSWKRRTTPNWINKYER